MNIQFRTYDPERDIDALIRFWGENSGWDVIDRTEWEHRFYDTPYGPAAIVIAYDSDTDELVGQFLFIPTLVQAKGQSLKGFRPYAPIIGERIRKELGMSTLFQVFVRMYWFSVEAIRQQGGQLLYIMPDPRWVMMFRLSDEIQHHNFPLLSLALPADDFPVMSDNLTTETLPPTDPRIDALWQNSQSNLYEYSVVRSTKTFAWKATHGDYRILGIFQNSELVGVTASVVKPQDKQWLLCDTVIRNDEALYPTLLATCRLAQETQQKEGSFQKIAVMCIPKMEATLRQLGFVGDEYQFPFVVHVLDPALNRDAFAPEHWYASATD